MANWLKYFDQTALGLLFTDQSLSPSEVVKIAQVERRAEKSQCRTANANPRCDQQPQPRLVGLR